MNIQEFASKNRLKVVKDDCGDAIISDKQGQLYEHSLDGSVFGVIFMPDKWYPKTWGNFRRKGQALGMTVRQNGDSEGCLSFDPQNREQVKLAIKMAGPRQKRQFSPEVLARKIEILAKARLYRQNPTVEAPLGV